MSVWLREIAGWLLLGCGLAFFYFSYQRLLDRRFLDVIPVTFIGYVVFRGGLHLIKVATAARACREATPAVKEKPPARVVRPNTTAVIPGQPAR
jgi:hypothetical protein